MTKIEALRKTIYNLENDVYDYSWINTDGCNCGILAKTVLGGKSPTECGLKDSPAISNTDGAFSKKAYCMTTNLPLPLVFQSLKDAGFTYQELVGLEYLGDKNISEKAGLKTSQSTDGSYFCVSDGSLGFTNKKLLTRYLKAWVEILEEQQSKEQEVKECDASKDDSSKHPDTIKTIHVYHLVEVSEEIKEMEKILN